MNSWSHQSWEILEIYISHRWSQICHDSMSNDGFLQPCREFNMTIIVRKAWAFFWIFSLSLQAITLTIILSLTFWFLNMVKEGKYIPIPKSFSDYMSDCGHYCRCLHKIDGLVQERRNSIANALELCLSCTNPSKWWSVLAFIIYSCEMNLTGGAQNINIR